jgi:hypothetical protein
MILHPTFVPACCSSAVEEFHAVGVVAGARRRRAAWRTLSVSHLLNGEVASVMSGADKAARIASHLLHPDEGSLHNVPVASVEKEDGGGFAKPARFSTEQLTNGGGRPS